MQSGNSHHFFSCLRKATSSRSNAKIEDIALDYKKSARIANRQSSEHQGQFISGDLATEDTESTEQKQISKGRS
jgi:hypothetical protein